MLLAATYTGIAALQRLAFIQHAMTCALLSLSSASAASMHDTHRYEEVCAEN